MIVLRNISIYCKINNKSFVILRFKIKIMRVIQFREAIAEAMSEEMRRDEKIFLLGEEVADTMVPIRPVKVC